MVKVEEEELSELQLRLLALQSASKKWQQKELQVMKESKDRISKASQEKTFSSGPGAAPPSRQRVTTRSASTAAALERSRTRSKALERDRDRAKAGARSQERDRDRPNAPERERPKPGPKSPLERARTPAKSHQGKKVINPGEETVCYSEMEVSFFGNKSPAFQDTKCKHTFPDWDHFEGPNRWKPACVII